MTLPLPAPCPPLLVRRRGWLRGGYSARRLWPGGEPFDRGFEVSCPVPSFENPVLSPDLRQRMLTHPAAWAIEHRIGPTELMVWHQGSFTAREVCWLVEYANGLLDQVLRAPWQPQS
ncbi:hypothetical protein N8J89_18625 [Crossiella sp. CA-258035]|uniref:hypothetical protein n=1 Tax=Crossiella sp. CA-258035 TaxID=2981138 RepID=UPI0024BBF2E2|nr:hypothetical protein [Crossiella sp. CA-258035]WHT23007.1 hypothetical protein N8J89_18625 [Crossiella sp. CA-258035]